MKNKAQSDPDIAAFMAKIQEQLAVMDRKLDSFMTKSLTELAQARAVQKPPQPHPVQHSPQPSPRPPEQRQGRTMYAVICFECGKDTEIPFKPSGDRPVYCKECFTKRKSGNAPKVNEPKPAVPLTQPAAPTVIEQKPAAAKKKPASSTKKSPAKKKAVVKKKAKKK